MSNEDLPVAVIGAGPVGLAAAAHLAERRLPFFVLEQGPRVAHAVAQWAHVRIFSPWRYNIDDAARRLLSDRGWSAPDPEHLPTGRELIADYLQPLADHPAIRPHLSFNLKVRAIGRLGIDKVRTAGRDEQPFEITLTNGGRRLARAIIDASGTWFSPNPLGAGGYPAPGEDEAARRIVYGIPDILRQDRARFAGKRVLVVGSGHSAIQSVLDLVRLKREAPDTKVTWAIRRDNPEGLFGGEDMDLFRLAESSGRAPARSSARMRSNLFARSASTGSARLAGFSSSAAPAD